MLHYRIHHTQPQANILSILYYKNSARLAGSDGSMSASGSAGPGFDPRRGIKFSLENFQLRS